MKNNIDELKKFESKQYITGKIFDFDAESDDNIYISKYYDIPSRKVVVIPDFVTGFKCKSEGLNIFSYCKYIEKVICSHPLQGSLTDLFKGSILSTLDLREFDTSLIVGFTNAFRFCNIKKLIIGDKFRFDSAKIMSKTFKDSNFNEIWIGDAFKNANNIKTIDGLFNYSNIQGKIDLSELRTDENISCNHAFSNLCANELILGKNANLHRETNVEHTFNGCNFGTLKIYSSSINTMGLNADKNFTSIVGIESLIVDDKYIELSDLIDSLKEQRRK